MQQNQGKTYIHSRKREVWTTVYQMLENTDIIYLTRETCKGLTVKIYYVWKLTQCFRFPTGVF